MRIEHNFEYLADWREIAEEFTDNDSGYQAKVINQIEKKKKKWSRDKEKTATYIQLLEIAEDLNDDGRWFVEILCDYMDNKVESEDKE